MSIQSESQRNWLQQVQADAAEATKRRLADAGIEASSSREEKAQEAEVVDTKSAKK